MPRSSFEINLFVMLATLNLRSARRTLSARINPRRMAFSIARPNTIVATSQKTLVILSFKQWKSGLQMTEEIESPRYPRVYLRIRAALIDSVILAAAFFGSAMTLASIDVGGGFKFLIIAFLIFVLEPFLVSYSGSSIGHRLCGIKVQDRYSGKNINIVLAVIRFFAKSMLGLYSFVLVVFTRRHQALHDVLTRSVVVFRYPDQVSEMEYLHERDTEVEGFVYPAKWRRILIILLYGFVSTILFNFLLFLLLSARCIESSICTSVEDGIVTLLSVTWLVCLVLIVVLGWKCRLFGARRMASK